MERTKFEELYDNKLAGLGKLVGKKLKEGVVSINEQYAQVSFDLFIELEDIKKVKADREMLQMKGKDPLQYRNDFGMQLSEDKYRTLMHIFSHDSWATDDIFKNVAFVVLDGRYPHIDLPKGTDVVYYYKDRRSG